MSDLHINASELKNIFFQHYNLEDAVVDRLEFSFESKIGDKGNTKIVRIEDDGSMLDKYKIRRHGNKKLPSCIININDISVKVRSQVGDVVEADASCDSAFMVPAMDRVGKSIQKAYWWIDMITKCFLVMNNAGGHGSNDASKNIRLT